MVFHYCHTSAYATGAKGRGQFNLGNQTSTAHAGSGHLTAVVVAADSGATEINLTLDNAYAATADEFKNGAIFARGYPFTGPLHGRIRTNDAEVAATGYTKFYLKEGMTTALVVHGTAIAKVHWNQYAYTGKPGTDSVIAHKTSVVGCPWVALTADYYYWGQSWGPYMGQTGETGSEDIGLGAHCGMVYFDSYGGFLNPSSEGLYQEQSGKPQFAGFVLGNRYTVSGSTKQWTPWVLLQITPL